MPETSEMLLLLYVSSSSLKKREVLKKVLKSFECVESSSSPSSFAEMLYVCPRLLLEVEKKGIRKDTHEGDRKEEDQ
jgi:hypothetical protein